MNEKLIFTFFCFSLLLFISLSFSVYIRANIYLYILIKNYKTTIEMRKGQHIYKIKKN